MNIEVNLVAVLVAAAANFILGMLWYSKLLFGKAWMKESGMTEKKMKEAKKKGMAKEMILAIIAALLMAYVLGQFVSLAEMTDGISGIGVAFWIWLGFMATLMLDGVLWKDESFKLWAINASYRLAGMFAMAAILVAWM